MNQNIGKYRNKNQRMNFDDSRIRIDWANNQIRKLTSDLDAFWKSDPYDIELEELGDGRSHLQFIRPTKKLPGLIVGDVAAIANSLRSSLDIMAHTLAQEFGETELKKVYFPFCRAQRLFDETLINRRLGKVSARYLDIFRELEPYPDGNTILYSLSEIDNESKHRNIPVVSGSSKSFSLEAMGQVRGFKLINELQSDGRTLICRWDATKGTHFKFESELAFQNIGEEYSVPIVERLTHLTNICNDTVNAVASV